MVIRFIGLYLCLSLLAGCSQLALIKETGAGRAPATLIASDLVNALIQIDALHPTAVRLEMEAPSHQFGKALRSVFDAAGYHVQEVTSRQGRHFVDYSRSEVRGSRKAGLFSYQISIGDVAIKRDYRIELGRVKPESHVYVRGADASSLTLNDQIFFATASSDAKAPSSMPVSVASALEPTPLLSAAKTQETAPDITLAVSNADSNMSTPGVVASPTTFSPGEPFKVTVSTSVDSRLYCYYRDGNDNIIKLYPNRFNSDNLLFAGNTLELPSSDQWQLQATRSGYSDEVMCVADAHSLTDPAKRQDRMKHPDFQPLLAKTLDQILSQFNSVDESELMSQRVLIDVN